MSIRVGIPRSLAYYMYYPLWKVFFQELGIETVCSPVTTKSILDAGVEETVNDACIPIKVFHGHAAYLKDKVHYLFVPRLVSVRKEGTETFCPKFLGLPDMIRSSINELPPLIDVRVDLKKGRRELGRVAKEIGDLFGKSKIQVCLALLRAKKAWRHYCRLMRKGLTPAQALEFLDGKNPGPVAPSGYGLTFGVVGYPYIVNDAYTSIGLIDKLRLWKIRVLTPEMVHPFHLRRQRKKLPKQLFWHFSNQTVRAGFYFLDNKRVDGLIHLTAFACGPDAMVGKLLELEAKEKGVPFLSLTVDEHTGEAGMLTRIEAFIDMLKLWRD